MKTVKIYQPAKSATQSGKAKTDHWILEYETTTKRQPDDLMGWISSADTLNQVRMKFSDKKDAITFAENKGWHYSVANTQKRKVKPRNYGDNFRYFPPPSGE